MSGHQYEAIPTQYAGVVFRSKSEALFARTLDLLGYAWFYEPDWLRCADGYVPDFLYCPARGDREYAVFSKMTVAEYKPQRPTDAYFAQFRKHELELTSRFPGWIGMFECVYGSFYSKNAFLQGEFFDCNGTLIQHGGRAWPWCAPSTIREARRYRFDIDPERSNDAEHAYA